MCITGGVEICTAKRVFFLRRLGGGEYALFFSFAKREKKREELESI